MKHALISVGSSALIGFALLIPLAGMEWVNRQSFRAAAREDFPSPLFIMLWLFLTAVIYILLPILQSMRTARHDPAKLAPGQGDPLPTNPRPALLISLGLLLPFAIVALLDSQGIRPLDHLFNGPDPAKLYIPGQFFALAFFFLPVAAGIVARRPVLSTLRAGGNLFAHPVNLVIVALIVLAIMMSLGSWIVDQWPCFMGVPNCD